MFHITIVDSLDGPNDKQVFIYLYIAVLLLMFRITHHKHDRSIGSKKKIYC
jgi:hypothetical protein